MQCEGFEIYATPFIRRAYCKDCHNSLVEVPNGFFGVAMFCSKCENVYLLKLIKAPSNKVSRRFLERTRKYIKANQQNKGE